MEFRTVIPDKNTTDKVIISCSHCNNVTTTYQYKGLETLNMTEIQCRGCGIVLRNLEELSKKPARRLAFHKS